MAVIAGPESGRAVAIDYLELNEVARSSSLEGHPGNHEIEKRKDLAGGIVLICHRRIGISVAEQIEVYGTQAVVHSSHCKLISAIWESAIERRLIAVHSPQQERQPIRLQIEGHDADTRHVEGDALHRVRG